MYKPLKTLPKIACGKITNLQTPHGDRKLFFAGVGKCGRSPSNISLHDAGFECLFEPDFVLFVEVWKEEELWAKWGHWNGT